MTLILHFSRMKQPGRLKKILSYLFAIPLKHYNSAYSGRLTVALEQGKKVLNTEEVNYSFNSLHRVFKQAFKKSGLELKVGSKILILGLGGGSIVQILREDYLVTSPIHIVEIDPVIIQIAKTDFEIHQYDPLTVLESDAAEFIESCKEVFDLICMDVFINDKVPEKFLGIELMEKLISILNPDGLLYFNVMVSDKGVRECFESMHQALENKKEILQLDVISLEENNRVLIVRK